MKSKLLTLTAVVMFVVACGTKKTVAETPPPPPPPPPKETAAKDLIPGDFDLAEGKSLYENSCARCHKLYEPKKFTKEEWQPILVRMQKKAKVDDLKMASITNYIHSEL